MTVVMATQKWASNAEMIADVAKLGYIARDKRTLDPTYGRGTFWKVFRPAKLVTHNMAQDGVDFRDLPYRARSFDTVVLDGPYKLNGKPTPEVDARYGVDVPSRWQDRIQLIIDGMTECERVLRPSTRDMDRHLLVKCQDQVVSGKNVWQTDIFTIHAAELGLVKVDRFNFLSYRAQPSNRTKKCQSCDGGRHPENFDGTPRYDKSCTDCGGEGKIRSKQQHAANNMSSLLVFQKPRSK